MLDLMCRAPAVAGRFYPASAIELRTELRRLLDAAPVAAGACPKALIVPHAGYVYSGATAAAAYASLAACAGRIRHVVLLGPAHRAPVRGLVAPGVSAFATPLGQVRLATEQIAALDEIPQCSISDAPHAFEHALEVQIPFLQTVLGEFDLLPLLVGLTRPGEVAQVLEAVWGGDDTLIVVSTDLSHYLPREVGHPADDITLATITALDPVLESEQACGAAPLNGLLLAARHHGLVPELIARADSGEASGDTDNVVGYAAYALRPTQPDTRPAAPERARTLTALARASIAAALGRGPAPTLPAAAWLQAPGASFVTLRHADGRLRGCVGGLVARQALGLDVIEHARAAALRDPRFAPVTPAELPELHVEVSVLSPPTLLHARTEDELAAQLRPGIDGLVLQAGTAHATFLPQVWDQLPVPREFLARLREKASLAPDAWNPGWRWERYTVERHEEPGHAAR